MADVTSEGRRLINDWLAATGAFNSACDQAKARQADLRQATRALAAWMLPADAAPGEKIAVWFGDSLIQIFVGHDAEYEITIRLRGRRLGIDA